MCVCDLGGVYIKPTRPWVVVHPPSPLANVHSSSSSSRPLTWSPGHLFVWSPCAVTLLPCCMVAWLHGHRLFARFIVLQLLRFTPRFAPFPFPLFTLPKFIHCGESLPVLRDRFNHYFWFGKFSKMVKTCRDKAFSFYSQQASGH